MTGVALWIAWFATIMNDVSFTMESTISTGTDLGSSGDLIVNWTSPFVWTAAALTTAVVLAWVMLSVPVQREKPKSWLIAASDAAFMT